MDGWVGGSPAKGRRHVSSCGHPILIKKIRKVVSNLHIRDFMRQFYPIGEEKVDSDCLKSAESYDFSQSEQSKSVFD